MRYGVSVNGEVVSKCATASQAREVAKAIGGVPVVSKAGRYSAELRQAIGSAMTALDKAAVIARNQKQPAISNELTRAIASIARARKMSELAVGVERYGREMQPNFVGPQSSEFMLDRSGRKIDEQARRLYND